MLAGGMVLGVGAAVTLAAWNDSEFAKGTFTAGAFNIEGSTTSATEGFDEHELSSTAADLVFNGNFGNLAPAESTYSPFWVRLDADSTSNATLKLNAVVPAADLNAEQLSYAIYKIDADAVCNAATVDEAGVGADLWSGTLDTAAVTGTGSVALTKGAAGVEGAATQLCIAVTAGADLKQKLETEATWEFVATSTN